MKRASSNELQPFWAAPGFEFDISWPPGPRKLFGLMNSDRAGSRQTSAAMSESRDRLMAEGPTDQKHAARGTLVGVFANTPKRDIGGFPDSHRRSGCRKPVKRNPMPFYFRGDSVAKYAYAMLAHGPIPAHDLAKHFGQKPQQLRDNLQSAIDAGVIVTKPIDGGHHRLVAYARGPVEPASGRAK